MAEDTSRVNQSIDHYLSLKKNQSQLIRIKVNSVLMELKILNMILMKPMLTASNQLKPPQLPLLLNNIWKKSQSLLIRITVNSVLMAPKMLNMILMKLMSTA